MEINNWPFYLFAHLYMDFVYKPIMRVLKSALFTDCIFPLTVKMIV